MSYYVGIQQVSPKQVLETVAQYWNRVAEILGAESGMLKKHKDEERRKRDASNWHALLMDSLDLARRQMVPVRVRVDDLEHRYED